VPVVASDIPGNRTLVDHQRHGLLAPPHDAQALGDSLLDALTQPASAAERAAAAYQRVRADYSLATMAARHLDLFAELRCRKRGRP